MNKLYNQGFFIVFLLLLTTVTNAQVQLTENFDSGNSIPTSSSNAPSVPTDYTTSSGVWTLFKSYRHGTTNYSAPYALRLLKNTADAPAYAITPVINSAGTISFWGYGSVAKPILIYKTTNNGTDWIFVDSVITGAGVFSFCSVTINDGSPNIRLKIVNGTGAVNDLNIDNVEITSYSSAPTIVLSAFSLPSFGTVVAGTSSGSSVYSFSAYNLSGGVNIYSPAGYRISLNDTLYSDSLNIAQSGGNIGNTNIYVKFTPSAAIGTMAGDIIHSSSGAVSQAVSVNGISIAQEPGQQSAITFGEVTGTTIKVNFSGGNGQKRILVARRSSAVSYVPTDGVNIAGIDSSFASALDQGGGNKVVYNGNGNSVTVTGLQGSSVYHFAVYEYNSGTNNSQNYNTVNPGTGYTTTFSVPTIIISTPSLAFGNVLINTTSEEKTYTISAHTLNPQSGNIQITAPNGFELSLTSGSGFTATIQLPYAGGIINSTTVYVRFKPVDNIQYSGNIIHSGGSAQTANLFVSGNGVTPAVPNEFQAEAGILTGSYIRQQYTGYTGWGYVDISDKTGGALEFVFRKANASTETVTIYYANGGSSRSFAVKLNDVLLGNLSFPSTGSWSAWSTVTYNVAFAAGINRLSFTSTTNNTNANIDKIIITGETATPVYKLRLLKSGNGTVSASLQNEYFDEGTVVTLTASPGAGAIFYRWNGSIVSYQNPLTVTMNSHLTQIALMNDTSGFATFPYEPAPRGFASVGGYTYPNGTTGGEGPESNEVYVSTAAELQNLMLLRVDANGTINFPPVKVYVTGILSRDAGIGEMVDVKDVYNISIIGVGTDATITGFGLNVTRSKNIIIRNIKFASWGDDAISVDGDDDPNKGNHIWIDHCTFTYTPPPGYPAATTPDGSIDITHAADYVTVSNCLFDATDKNSLVGHSNTNVVDTVMKITYHGNWFKASNQRNPRVRFAKVHVFNNYYTNNSIYGVSSNMEADVLVEGNYFFNTPIPTETSRDGSPPGDLVERFNIFESCGTPGTRGTAFEASDYYLYTLDPASLLPAMVPAVAGSGKYDFSNPVHIIPVELVSFRAAANGRSIMLSWLTASEKNNAGFEVQRESDNGWTTIGYVQGEGTSASPRIYSFNDQSPISGLNRYRLKQIDYDGSYTYSSVAEAEASPADVFSLSRNYPNPFNPATVISYSIPVKTMVILNVYDILGNKVKELVNELQNAGEYSVKFDGSGLSSGVYIYKLQAGDFLASQKMLLIK